MDIFFFEMEEEFKKRLVKAAREQKHRVITYGKADIVFMMAYPHMLNRIAEAARNGRYNPLMKPVVLLRVTQLDTRTLRLVFKTRVVLDIVEAPYTESAAQEILEAIEHGDTLYLR